MRDAPLYPVFIHDCCRRGKGALTAVDGTHITGWLKNDADSGEAAVVELHIYKDGNSEAAKVITVPEESYSNEAGNSTGDGRRVFDYKINWQELGGTACKVEAFLVSGDKKTLLTGAMEYKPSSEVLKKTESSGEEIGPGIPKKEEIPAEQTFEGYKKGESLGIFKTTGYCSCSKCSGGSGLTYSGTVPQPNHTISADITVLPLGTKVIIRRNGLYRGGYREQRGRPYRGSLLLQPPGSTGLWSKKTGSISGN